MGDKAKKVTIIAGRSGIVVEEKASRPTRKLRWRLFVIAVFAVAAVAIVVFLMVSEHRHHEQTQTAAKQQVLQKSLTSADALGDPDKLKQDSDSLITGAENGTYNVSDQELAQAYANRGDVSFNAGEYSAAVADYKRAVQLDGAQQDLVGYNEFVARYKLGERDSLISLLKRLQKPYKNNHATGMQEHYEQYQSYIDNLEAGKELEL